MGDDVGKTYPLDGQKSPSLLSTTYKGRLWMDLSSKFEGETKVYERICGRLSLWSKPKEGLFKQNF